MTDSGVAEDESPEAIVRSVILALDERHWDVVLRAVDPAELDRWRGNMLGMARQVFAETPEAAQAQWGVADVTELESLGTQDLFCRWLAASSPENRMRAAFHPVGDPPPAPKIERTVLGSVREGDTVTHVLYRESMGEPGTIRAAPRIATLRFTHIGWRMDIDYQMMGNLGWYVCPGPRRPPPP